jgi:hypothetical protein
MHHLLSLVERRIVAARSENNGHSDMWERHEHMKFYEGQHTLARKQHKKLQGEGTTSINHHKQVEELQRIELSHGP